MSRNYSSRDFFRRMPNAMLARYFERRGLLAGLDFAAMKEGRPEPLLEAWAALPDAQRNEAEADFREIHALSNGTGYQALIDEARWQLEDEPDDLASFLGRLDELADHHARVMEAFLSHPECWKGATRFYAADRLSYWRKRKNLPKKPAAADKAAVDRLAALLRSYFTRTEGRGKHCVVEAYRRGDKDYFFAFPEDHAERGIHWVGDDLQTRPHNPAFEIVFVYTQAKGSLDVNCRSSLKTVEALQGLFAQAILGLDELPPDPKDARVYDLGPLARRGFQFTHAAGSGIGTVVVKKLRFSSSVRTGDRITVEADGSTARDAIYDLVDQVAGSVPLNKYFVTLVELVATVVEAEGRPPKNVSFRITHPNSCSLKYEGIDLALRQMLEASRIEPHMRDAAAPAGKRKAA